MLLKKKSWLVAQDYSQIEGVDFGETFAPVARLESIWLLLEQGFARGGLDKTMFIKKQRNEFLVAQVYMDDIVFSGYPDSLILTFVDQIKKGFEMSMAKVKRTFVATQIKVLKGDGGKKDFEYVLRTVDFRIWQSFDTTVVLLGYYNVDWAGCPDDKNRRLSKTPDGTVEHVVVESDSDDDVALMDVMHWKIKKAMLLKPVWENLPRNISHLLCLLQLKCIVNYLTLRKTCKTLTVPQNLGARWILIRMWVQVVLVHLLQFSMVFVLYHRGNKSSPLRHDLRIANESIVFDQLHSCATVIDLIAKAGLMCTVTNPGIFL
ncbi:putative mitochondrial protein [Cucumis melo var. makuwa]|uniref:Mitochondrial protein n=1 Tax=Cucumis melo var. makuwa TaxID=1194695 RepID=A0A5A7VE46_CUCMM|nr:putative mitochondrial protein [Cucumis melo var. makuwa]